MRFGLSEPKKYLKPTVDYIGVDYIKRDDETIVCDFNNGEFPKVQVDTVFVSDVLEYIGDPQWFWEKLAYVVTNL